MSPTRPLTVLAVDDQAMNLILIQAILEGLAEVILAPDGAVAVELGQQQAFDLILMDVQMPRMNGLDAVRALRAGPGPNTRTPIVMLTGNNTAQDIAASMDAGADRHMAKPYAPHRLLELLDEVADGSMRMPAGRSRVHYGSSRVAELHA